MCVDVPFETEPPCTQCFCVALPGSPRRCRDTMVGYPGCHKPCGCCWDSWAGHPSCCLGHLHGSWAHHHPSAGKKTKTRLSISRGIKCILMPKAWPLCTIVKSNFGDRVLDEVEKNSLMLCQAKWGTAGSCPENYVIRSWRIRGGVLQQ